MAALRAVLAECGYELRYREDAWVECLLLGDGESFLGRGRDRDAALLDALDKSCPSVVSRRAIAELVERKVGCKSVTVELPLPVAEPRPIVRAREPSPREPSGPPPLVSKDAAPIRIDLARALDDLMLLEDRIRDSRDELGLCSPERQRLAILSWICEARGHTDLFPAEAKVREVVAGISRKLTEVGKSYWPGSVTALQLQMSPRDLPRPLLGGTASTWGRAAELAERALSTLEHGDERRGFDAYGWGDAGRIDPVPARPDELLGKLVAEIEKVGGTLDRCAEACVDGRPEADDYLRWVRALRWLRVTAVDADRWAKAAGRLRWWGSRRDPKLLPGVRELEPSYAPPVPWATYFATEATSPCCSLSPPKDLLEEVAPRIEGKKVLLASFRRDPELFGRLNQALPGAILDWRVLEPARFDELKTTLEAGAIDVVLGAIGLQSHGADQLLARACRTGGVSYVRVNWGRPLVCLRALAYRLCRSKIGGHGETLVEPTPITMGRRSSS
jgi:hypothetical protein